MCFYKANKPPCVCKTRYLARHCWRATFYRSYNSNPNPIVQVCGVVETATDVPPATKPLELRRLLRDQGRRQSGYGHSSHGLSRSVLSSSSSSCPESVVPANVVEQHHRPRNQKQNKTPRPRRLRKTSTTKVLPYASRRATTTRLAQEPSQKQAQQPQPQPQPQPAISVTEATPTETTMSDFFDFSSFDDITISLPEGSSTYCIGERLDPNHVHVLETEDTEQQQQQQQSHSRCRQKQHFHLHHLR
ncbi:hypothetical protein T310_2373 [Rasamsonia emersonii CBS 393.64]|uniref:Uncharacterized protein n=1 Tax=Rasamsonia emersonii (strain ATCC 16479 / CBS 393.64 / IMI 116815) TaxID=1408163 RepID=A0A0F4Z0H4_RASE3|nr:hypothetical protein T310_2373 [Rasamsonia emersonii CBS 393.64]KKA23591.1 hypothetical protein T310_2373 [Rasamsonia emersonii CBS 393.64]